MSIAIFWNGRPKDGFQHIPKKILVPLNSVGFPIALTEIIYGNFFIAILYFIITIVIQFALDKFYQNKKLKLKKEKNKIFQEAAAKEAERIRETREKVEAEIRKEREDKKVQNLRNILDKEGEEYEDEEEDEDDIDFELKEKKRKPISQSVKDKVWRRDEGKCVSCGSNENLEFDHIIPHSKGGADTYRNLQLLCEPCNRKKSDKIG